MVSWLWKHRRGVVGCVVIVTCSVAATLGVLTLAPGRPQSACAVEEGQEPPDRREVVRAVRAREMAARTVQYSSAHSMLVPKLSLPARDEAGTHKLQGGPEKDTVTEKSVAIVMDGSRMYAAVGGPQWTTADGGHFFEAQEALWMLEDGVCVEYHEWEGANANVNFLPHTLPQIIPIVIAYRFLDPVLGLAQTYELFPVDRVDYDGHPSVVMEYRRSMYDLTDRTRYWLAEDMDYCVLRYESYAERGSGTELIRSVQFKYEPAEKGIWRLVSWSLDQPTAVAATYGTATDVTVKINGPVGASVFDWQSQLPAGTMVRDYVQEQRYEVGGGSAAAGPLIAPPGGVSGGRLLAQLLRLSGARTQPAM